MPEQKEKFWMRRSKHGRDKIFSTPEILWDAACEYFQWAEDNPLIEHKVAQYQGEPVKMEVPRIRALTLDGLYLFLDIGSSTWTLYRDRDDFVEVITKIENSIREQKFAGAAADLLNANIIARDLGLRDKSEIDHLSKDGSMSPKSLSDEDLKKEIAKYALKSKDS